MLSRSVCWRHCSNLFVVIVYMFLMLSFLCVYVFVLFRGVKRQGHKAPSSTQMSLPNNGCICHSVINEKGLS
jgi:hypothetical protein